MTRRGLPVCLAICAVVVVSNGGLSSPGAGALLAQRKVTLTFTPQDGSFADATDAYRRLWADEGDAIIAGLERASGLTFPETDVKAIVFEGVSSSGFGNTPMHLRASYPADVKKATLAHELGHRMNAQLRKRPREIDEHRLLFLYLYEVWESLWGKEFADRQVVVESGRKGLYDYEAAWKWALALGKDQRASQLADIRRANRR
jgi:hypothetical protein